MKNVGVLTGRRNMMLQILTCSTLLFFASTNRSQAQVDRLRVIVENEGYPGDASVYIPHVGRWIPTKNGVALLPGPYGGHELITVKPTDPLIYGPPFQRLFPGDGVISLYANIVTVGIRHRAEELRNSNPAQAATGFAIAATRASAVDPAQAADDQSKALDSLAAEYRSPTAYVREGNSVRASPELVTAISSKLGQGTVPTDGKLTLKDITKASGVKTFTPVIADAQRQHFNTLKAAKVSKIRL